MFYQLWKLKLDIYVFNLLLIIENNLYGMVTVSVTFHNVIVFQCYFYTLIHFWLLIQCQLIQSFFFQNIKFDELLSEIGNVLQKKDSLT